MGKPLFHPWISDEEPKAPKGWGLDAYRGTVNHFICIGCWKKIKLGQQYLYSYDNQTTTIVHNKKKCWRNRA